MDTDSVLSGSTAGRGHAVEDGVRTLRAADSPDSLIEFKTLSLITLLAAVHPCGYERKHTD